MAPPLSALKTDAELPRPRDGWRSALLWGAGGCGALLLAGALALWFHYGTAVFFETIATGFANCF